MALAAIAVLCSPLLLGILYGVRKHAIERERDRRRRVRCWTCHEWHSPRDAEAHAHPPLPPDETRYHASFGMYR